MVWNEGGFTPWSINTAFHSSVCVWSWSHVSVHLMFLCLYLCLDRDVLYVIEFMVHWWKPMHLQYHKICVCGVMCVCGQNPKWRTVSDAVFNNPVVICPSLRNRLCLQLQVNCYYGRTEKRRLQVMELPIVLHHTHHILWISGKWGPKTHTNIREVKDNKTESLEKLLSMTNHDMNETLNTLPCEHLCPSHLWWWFFKGPEQANARLSANAGAVSKPMPGLSVSLVGTSQASSYRWN